MNHAVILFPFGTSSPPVYRYLLAVWSDSFMCRHLSRVIRHLCDTPARLAPSLPPR